MFSLWTKGPNLLLEGANALWCDTCPCDEIRVQFPCCDEEGFSDLTLPTTLYLTFELEEECPGLHDETIEIYWVEDLFDPSSSINGGWVSWTGPDGDRTYQTACGQEWELQFYCQPDDPQQNNIKLDVQPTQPGGPFDPLPPDYASNDCMDQLFLQRGSPFSGDPGDSCDPFDVRVPVFFDNLVSETEPECPCCPRDPVLGVGVPIRFRIREIDPR